MFRSHSRGDLHTGSAALLGSPSTLSLRLMRLFVRWRFSMVPSEAGSTNPSPDAIAGHQRQRAVDIVPVPRRQKAIHKCFVIARHLDFLSDHWGVISLE